MGGVLEAEGGTDSPSSQVAAFLSPRALWVLLASGVNTALLPLYALAVVLLALNHLSYFSLLKGVPGRDDLVGGITASSTEAGRQKSYRLLPCSVRTRGPDATEGASGAFPLFPLRSYMSIVWISEHLPPVHPEKGGRA